MHEADVRAPSAADDSGSVVVQLCPECAHPWTMHDLGGCNAGVRATPGEHCPCEQSIPLLAGENIDVAALRLGEVPPLESSRLIYGTRLVENLRRIVGEHLDRAAAELAELTGTVVDLDMWLGQLEAVDPAGSVDELGQGEIKDMVSQLRHVLAEAETIMAAGDDGPDD